MSPAGIYGVHEDVDTGTGHLFFLAPEDAGPPCACGRLPEAARAADLDNELGVLRSEALARAAAADARPPEPTGHA